MFTLPRVRRSFWFALTAIAAVTALGAVASAVTTSTTVVHPGNFGDPVNAPGWFFYNDENDTTDNSLGTFVTGPDTAPLGTGSVEIRSIERRPGARVRCTV